MVAEIKGVIPMIILCALSFISMLLAPLLIIPETGRKEKDRETLIGTTINDEKEQKKN